MTYDAKNPQVEEQALIVERLVLPFKIAGNASSTAVLATSEESDIIFFKTQGTDQIAAEISADERSPVFGDAANDANGVFNIMVKIDEPIGKVCDARLYRRGATLATSAAQLVSLGTPWGVVQLNTDPVFPSAPVGSPDLGAAVGFAILGASAITNTGSSVITGDLGLSPGTSVTGFPPGTVIGTKHVTDGAAANAQIAATAAYTDLSTRSANAITAALDGQTLNAGVYKEASGTFNLATSADGTLTLNGPGIFVFQAASTLVTGAGGTPTIAFTGGASAANVYWVVGSSATLNGSATGAFQGTVIAQDSITIDGGTASARLFALTGAVTISAAITASLPDSGLGPIPAAPTCMLSGKLLFSADCDVDLSSGTFDGTLEVDYEPCE